MAVVCVGPCVTRFKVLPSRRPSVIVPTAKKPAARQSLHGPFFIAARYLGRKATRKPWYTPNASAHSAATVGLHSCFLIQRFRSGSRLAPALLTTLSHTCPLMNAGNPTQLVGSTRWASFPLTRRARRYPMSVEYTPEYEDRKKSSYWLGMC